MPARQQRLPTPRVQLGGGASPTFPPQRMFAPSLPSDLLVNVYINLNKLCLTVYQLHALQPNSTKVRPCHACVRHQPLVFCLGPHGPDVSA